VTGGRPLAVFDVANSCADSAGAAASRRRRRRTDFGSKNRRFPNARPDIAHPPLLPPYWAHDVPSARTPLPNSKRAANRAAKAMIARTKPTSPHNVRNLSANNGRKQWPQTMAANNGRNTRPGKTGEVLPRLNAGWLGSSRRGKGSGHPTPAYPSRTGIDLRKEPAISQAQPP
jgi:hypothetical protein